MSIDQPELLQDETLTNKFVTKGFWLYFFAFLVAPIGYLIRIMLSDTFDPAEIGLFYSTLGLITFLSAYNDLGLTEALQYFVPQYVIGKQKNFLTTSIVITLLIQFFSALLLIGCLFFGGAEWLAIHHFGDPRATELLHLLMWFFLGINLFQVIQAITLAVQDTWQSRFIDFVRYFGTLSFTFYYFLQGNSTLGDFVFAWLVGLFIGLFIAIVLFFKKYRGFITEGKLVYDRSEFNRYTSYALWTFLAMNSGTILGQLDQQMVINMLGASDAGYYANYNSLLGIYGLVFGPLLGFLFPVVSEIVTKRHNDKLILLQKYLYNYLFIFAVSIAIFFSIFGKEFAVILFSEKFAFSGVLLSWASALIPIFVLTSVSFSILAGLGKMKHRVYILVGAVIINVIMNLIFFPLIGLYGVIVSTFVGQLFMFAVSTYLVHRHEAITVDKVFILKDFILFLALGGLLFLVKYMGIVDTTNRLFAFLSLAVLALLYYGIFMIFNINRIREAWKNTLGS